MNQEQRFRFSLSLGILGLIFLIGWTRMDLPDIDNLLLAALFALLILFTTTFGVPLAGGVVSLLPMTTATACLVVGPVSTAWASFVASVMYGIIRYRWAETLRMSQRITIKGVVGLTAVNSAMHSVSILVSGWAFQRLGGATPLMAVQGSDILPLVSLGLIYLAINYLIAGIYMAARGREALWFYLRSLPNVLLYEGAPLIFAPLTALIYTQLGVWQFALFALVLAAASLITRDMAFSRQRLERRIKELNGLQAVGQALSASLEIETVVSAIYDQVVELMPALNFYVALRDTKTDEVSFPLAVEEGERVQWQSRRMSSGLTEYIMQSREPLLISRDVSQALQELGLDSIGRTAECWLGVPMLAGDEVLGVIAVQSYSTPGAYDDSHKEILVTIAAQAAVAIQNARLYARTDEALARRVQELDSILRTTREGILLVSPEKRVLAANRALADFVGVAQVALTGRTLDHQVDGERPLAALIGYATKELEQDFESLADGEWTRKQSVVALESVERHVERTLTPVRDRGGTIVGWLFVLRDITEEIKLAQLRDDMTHMLVHDLRSPLTVLKGSLHFMGGAFAKQKQEKFDQLLDMAQQSSERMLDMVNGLLDISKLESGELALAPQELDAQGLLEEVAARLATLATSARIRLEISAEPNLPPLIVDASLMVRVLNNLLDNAIKFTPDGGLVQLWARFDPERSPSQMLVGVSDTGPGVPVEAIPKLFAKFQQVDSIEGRYKGTGLGLPFCKLVVEAHEGEIWVESKVGEGSTFVMALPIAEPVGK